MKESDVERLMGHAGNWSNASYNRPPEDWLIEAYLKAIPDLTIYKPNEVAEQTQKQTQELTERMESNDQEIRALREQNQIMSKQLAAVIEQQQQHADIFDTKLVKLFEIVKTPLVDQDEATRSFISGEIVKMMRRKLTTKELQKIEAHRNLTGVFIDSTDSKGS
jgi:restriction endonuclease